MLWGGFMDTRLGLLIVCDEGGIGTNEYKDILYDGLFWLIDDLLQPLEHPNTIQITNENTFLFMQDNVPYHKSTCLLEFLEENWVSVMQWPLQSSDLNLIENL